MFLDILEEPGVSGFYRGDSEGGVELVVWGWVEEVDSCGSGVEIRTVDKIEFVGWRKKFAEGCWGLLLAFTDRILWNLKGGLGDCIPD